MTIESKEIVHFLAKVFYNKGVDYTKLSPYDDSIMTIVILNKLVHVHKRKKIIRINQKGLDLVTQYRQSPITGSSMIENMIINMIK